MNKSHLRLIYILFTIFITSCSSKKDNQQQEQIPPQEVYTAKLTKGKAIFESQYATAIEAISSVEIRPQVSGYLQKIFVEEGAYVTKGQSLFQIDNRIYLQQLNSARANLASVKAKLISAQLELNRKKELEKTKMVSSIQVQEADAMYKAALAAIASAESAVELAKINLEFSTIKAPVSGYLGRFNYRLGSLLSPSNALAITQLNDNQRVYAYFSLSENDFVGFNKNLKGNSVKEKLENSENVQLLLASQELYETKGKIDAIEGHFNKSTGAITLRAVFDNPKGFLRTGNTGKIILKSFLNDALLLPISATVSIQDKIYAYTFDKENKAQQVLLNVIGKSGTNYVISDGLKEGQNYITTGFARLQNGSPIVVKENSKN